MSEFVPYVAHRPDGRVVIQIRDDTRWDMNAAYARWLANELTEAAERIDKLCERE